MRLAPDHIRLLLVEEHRRRAAVARAQLRLFGPFEREVEERARWEHERLCLDCDADTPATGEMYIVTDEVWLQANPDYDGMLCIGCLEARLGRRLTPSDFTDVPLNDSSTRWQSPRLRARLGAPAA